MSGFVFYFFPVGFRWRFGPVILSQLFTILQLLIKTNSSLKLFLTMGKIYILKLKLVFSLFSTLRKHPRLLLQQSPTQALRAPCQACDIYCLKSPSSRSEVIRWEPQLSVKKKEVILRETGNHEQKAESRVQMSERQAKRENPTCIIIF